MAATATKPALGEVLSAYLDSWNTDDPAERARLLGFCVTDDVEFVDPITRIFGRADLAQHIAATRATYPGMSLAASRDPDAHNHVVRAPWLVRIDGKVVLRGLDVDEVGDDGRLGRIIGFFDREAE
jgi:hypothetical protein